MTHALIFTQNTPHLLLQIDDYYATEDQKLRIFYGEKQFGEKYNPHCEGNVEPLNSQVLEKDDQG